MPKASVEAMQPKVFTFAFILAAASTTWAACQHPIDDQPRVQGQEQITPTVAKRFTGVWYEDYAETARFAGVALGMPTDAVQRKIAEAKRELAKNPAEPVLVVQANGEFRWGHSDSWKQLRPRQWVIDLPADEGCAQVYSIGGAFYRGSREYLFVRLVHMAPK